MIEGLKIEISSDNLRAHLLKRAVHHRQKAALYGEKIDSLKSSGVEVQAMSNDPIHSLQSSQRTHAQSAAFFQGFADNLVPNERYRLNEHELSRIEFLNT